MGWFSQAMTIFGSGAAAATILAIFGFIFRDVLLRLFINRSAHHNNQRIAELEDRLSRERSQIDDLRQIVIRSVSTRNEKLLEKQVAACEDLWRATVSNKKYIVASKCLQSINIDQMNMHIGDGKVSQFIDAIAQTSGVQKLIDEQQQQTQQTLSSNRNTDSAALTKPFISPRAWVLYSLHSSIIWHAVLTLVGWKNGITTELLKNDELLANVKNALPHTETLLDEHGVGGTYFLLDEIEEALLKELKQALKVGETDQDAVFHAQTIALSKTPS